MQADNLDELLAKNAHLRSEVYSRAAFVDYELDRLRCLRAELALASTPSRKRKRSTEQVLYPDSLSSREVQRLKFRPAFLAALAAEVKAQSLQRGVSPWALGRDAWEQIATSLATAGHRLATLFELQSAFRQLHCTKAGFTRAETEALCQLVAEKGLDWPAVGQALLRRFGRERSPFHLAKQYRLRLQRVFVQRNLTEGELATLLGSEARPPPCRDYDRMSVEAKGFASHKLFQVDPVYLQNRIHVLAFERYVPARYQLYWKVVNLLYPLPLCEPYRLDIFHHKGKLCYEQRSFAALSRHLECSAEELKEKVIQHLLSVSGTPRTIDFEECSRTLFGTVSAARLIYQLAEELHERGP